MGETNTFDLEQIEQKIQVLLRDFESERSQKQLLEKKNDELMTQIARLKEQIEKEASTEKDQIMKDDLADILIEAKKTANQMIERAEKEGMQILENKKKEIEVIVSQSLELADRLEIIHQNMNKQFDGLKHSLRSLTKDLYEK